MRLALIEWECIIVNLHNVFEAITVDNMTRVHTDSRAELPCYLFEILVSTSRV